MGLVYEEFERELARAADTFRKDPAAELTRLFLMALEREQIVSVAYRESLISSRLERMDVPLEVRNVISHALLWAWKDEEMHAIYIRGAILKLAGPWLRAKAFTTQAAGALGGWAASVQQHARWKDAPLSRAISAMLTAIGRLSGKVPGAVRKQLDYGPFRNFCLFNVDAEKTAWLCWHRIAQLARDVSGCSEKMLADFARIEQDELQHEQVFSILAGALTDEDQLAPGHSAETLLSRLQQVGEFYVPRARRARHAADNPIGSGGRVHVHVADAREEKLPAFRSFLDACGLKDALEQRSRSCNKPLTEFAVAVKPTLMLGYHRKDPSPLTDPALVRELAIYLKDLGCAKVAVVESPNIYDSFYANRSVEEVATYFHYHSEHYSLVDMSREQVPHGYSRGLAQYHVSRTWKEADFRISFSKMRSHPVELALLTIGNMEGIGNRCEDFLFVERQAQRETAVMTQISEFPSHFALLDAFENVPDGILGVMGCPEPVHPLRFYGGRDALAVDIVAGRHVGMKAPHQSSVLQAAIHWFGMPDPVVVTGTDSPLRNWKSPYHNEFSTLLCFLALPVYVMGSGRGSLFVPEMDEQAFPFLQPEGILARATRKFLRAFLGLRHPR